MNAELIRDLESCETDIAGAKRRFSFNEELYTTCLRAFLEDQSMSDLETAIDAEQWDDAFTAAHALKGLAGNMGFVPLFHASAHLVILIRAGKTKELAPAFKEAKLCYDSLASLLKKHFDADMKGTRQ